MLVRTLVLGVFICWKSLLVPMCLWWWLSTSIGLRCYCRWWRRWLGVFMAGFVWPLLGMLLEVMPLLLCCVVMTTRFWCVIFVFCGCGWLFV